jgi:hypothetical protein
MQASLLSTGANWKDHAAGNCLSSSMSVRKIKVQWSYDSEKGRSGSSPWRFLSRQLDGKRPSHQSAYVRADEMRLGLRRPAHRAHCARTLHHMPEAAGGLRAWGPGREVLEG